MPPGAVTNAMTVDVEDYFHVSAFASSVRSEQWSGLESRVERNTQRLVELFGRKGIRATFFVLGWVAERFPALVREIGAAGHEVGCHGYSHRLVYDQTREEFATETRRAKAAIEQALGASIRGYRAASFSITSKTLWALDEIAAAGFEYDSSVAPMRHDIYGWLNGPRVPTRLRTEGGAELVEFPVMLARWGRVSLPVAGGGYFRILPYALVSRGLARINALQQPFFFYLHPWEIDPGQPRIEAGLKSRLRHYTGLASCEARLGRLMDEFRFGAMADVLAAQALPAAAVRP
ncbi:MAG: XrtA system polysaccharide deacetylase [Steroidobacteraceae bacterium]